jgi:hypothetical protein
VLRTWIAIDSVVADVEAIDGSENGGESSAVAASQL